jgi:hypothetical protein
MHRLVYKLALTFSLAVLAVGCSENTGGRVGVNGDVKLKGKPVASGTVSFEPLEKQDTRATATITDGVYTIPAKAGLKPGKYLIRVSAGDGKTAINPVDASNPPGPGGGTNIISKELVPRDWNVNSKQERAITADNPNNVNFDIP